MALPYELDGHAHDDAERVQDNKRQVTNYCPLCEHYASSAEKLNDENRTLRQRVEELERAPRCCADTIPLGCRTCRCADAAEAKLARVVEALDRYAQHMHGCNALQGGKCDPVCGLDAALAAAKGEKC